MYCSISNHVNVFATTAGVLQADCLFCYGCSTFSGLFKSIEHNIRKGFAIWKLLNIGLQVSYQISPTTFFFFRKALVENHFYLLLNSYLHCRVVLTLYLEKSRNLLTLFVVTIYLKKRRKLPVLW